MRIALDWDNTFTSDTVFWQKFILSCPNWDVYIVTARSPDVPIEFIPEGIKGVIYCSWEAKKNHFNADIWIDDDPGAIINGYVVTPDGLYSG